MNWIKTARIVMVFITIVVIAIYLPYYYWLSFDVKDSAPVVVIYSPIAKKFFFIRSINKQSVYSDADGNNYKREEFELLNPLNYYRQLSLIQKLPDSLDGVKLDVRTIHRNNFFFRFFPDQFDQPQIPIYPLFESQSGRVSLELPDNYFRFNSKMEFINAKTNQVNEEMTKEFTSILTNNKFSFPAKSVFGNPTTKKPYDEGYFVIDAENKVFHIKLVKGKPFCININVPPTLDIIRIYVNEIELREFYGHIVTRDNKVFLLSCDNYKLIQLPIENYNYKNTTLMMRGDLLYRTISLKRNNNIEVVVTGRDYQVITKYKETWKNRSEFTAGFFANILFPFTISLSSESSTFANLYFSFSNSLGLIGIAVSLIISLCVMKTRKTYIKNSLFDICIVLLTGIYGLIATLIIADVKKSQKSL